MDSTLLEYFLRVAELGSINRAAADLSLSQPALSRHIASLEKEMRGELFTRTRGGVVLTEAGQLLADRARPLLRQFTMVREQVGELAAGHLALGVPQAWKHVVTAAFVSRFIGAHPQVALRVHDGVSNVLRDYLSAGVLDLCVMPFEPAASSAYSQTQLVREPLIAVADQRAALRPSEPLSVSHLNDVKLVLPGRANVLRQQVEHALVRRNMQFRIAIETDTLDLCLEFARQGIGITVVPASALQGRPHDERISWAPLKGLFVTWALYENRARVHSDAVRTGHRLMLQTVAERAGPDWFGAERIDDR